MIKSFHRLFVTKTDGEYEALKQFFSSLGLAHGEAWDGQRSRGIKLDAPESGVEVGFGEGFPKADLVIEADSADIVYELLQKQKIRVVEEISDTDWGARIFSVALPGINGVMAVFSYKDNWRHENVEGKLDATGLRVAIVVSRFNAFVTERLLSGAVQAMRQAGAKNSEVKIVRVPGAFEIPTAARALAETGDYDAIVCIGCLLRGNTLHYEVIANEVTRGIGEATQQTGVPMGFGVLTCDTLEQAIDRAGLKAGNKGFEAAMAAIEMATLKSQVKK